MKNTYWISNPIRREVAIKSKGFCYHCKKKAKSVTQDRWGILHFKDKDGISFEIDHLVARRNGGREDTENLVISCRDCNRKKKRATLNQQEDIKKILNSINRRCI